MWRQPTNEYRRELGDGLVIRTPISLEDVERLAQFQSGIHGSGVGPFVRNLLLNHPHMTPEDQIFVETESGEIVSALCLIPEKWDIDGALLNVGELGVVATAEAFRRKGLVREQMVYFVSGPVPMIRAVKRELRELGIPLRQIEEEQYEMA